MLYTVPKTLKEKTAHSVPLVSLALTASLSSITVLEWIVVMENVWMASTLSAVPVTRALLETFATIPVSNQATAIGESLDLLQI